VSNGTAVAAAVAGLLLCVKGGMLYDRTPSFDAVGWLGAAAVPLAAVVIGAALTAWAWADGRSARIELGWGSVAGVCAVLLTLWAAVRVAGAPFMYSALVALGMLGMAVGTGCLVGAGARSPRVAATAVSVLVVAAVALSVTGLREYLTEWKGGNPGWRVFAGFAVPNFLAGLLVTVLPLVAALFVSVRDRMSAIALGLALALVMCTLLLTQSRLGVAALAVAALVLCVAALWSGALRGAARGRALVMVLVVVVAGAIGAGPVVKRLRASRDQSYSARFRYMTWMGVRRMVAARPLAGSGTGSFDVAYPRFAVVGYTQHAHNSYLQWASETGIPGAVLLVAVALGSALTGLRALRRPVREDWLLGDERLVAAGLLAGLVGAAAHNVFDSDLYVPANAETLGLVCGMLVYLGRRARSSAEGQGPRRWSFPIPAWLWRPAAGAGGLLLVFGGGALMAARSWSAAGADALARQDPLGALAAYAAAARANPLDPESRLALAHIREGIGEPDAARRELSAAVRIAPVGKTLYRLGKHLLANGDPSGAARALDRARALDPHHLRTLLALAEANRSAGRPEKAAAVYDAMIALHRGPVGRVRAVPEVVDWEYGIAYAARAEQELQSDRPAHAERLLAEAESVLGELWRTRHETMVRLRVTDDAMREAVARYEWVLMRRAEALGKVGRAGEAQTELARLARFRQEHAEETAPE